VLSTIIYTIEPGKILKDLCEINLKAFNFEKNSKIDRLFSIHEFVMIHENCEAINMVE